MEENEFKAFLQDESFINYCLENKKEDVAKWNRYLHTHPEHSLPVEELKQVVISMAYHAANSEVDQSYLQLKNRIEFNQEPSKPVFKLGWLKYAAAVLIVLGVAIFWVQSSSSDRQQLLSSSSPTVVPGGHKAILTLSNGTKISLTDAAKGLLKNEDEISITKSADGEVVYAAAVSGNSSNRVIQHTIETPSGGEYEITLPDGSKAWLNAESSLKYPVSFSGKERRVEMTGEVYFEIAKNRNMPFKIRSANQEIEVLGTHFNVNAYADEAAVRTTLLEGSVRVQMLPSSPAIVEILKPGEQSVLTANGIEVKRVDTEETMAWRNGDFIFERESLPSILRKVSRWYDVEVIYKIDADAIKFDGMVSRKRNIAAVLNMIESTGNVHFKLEGRRLIVMK